jgi:hypothetical protein
VDEILGVPNPPVVHDESLVVWAGVVGGVKIGLIVVDTNLRIA